MSPLLLLDITANTEHIAVASSQPLQFPDTIDGLWTAAASEEQRESFSFLLFIIFIILPDHLDVIKLAFWWQVLETSK